MQLVGAGVASWCNCSGYYARTTDVFSEPFNIYMDHKSSFFITFAGWHSRHIRCRLEFLTVNSYKLEHRKARANNRNAGFLSRLSQLATSVNTSEECVLSYPNHIDGYFVRTAGLGLRFVIRVPTILPYRVRSRDDSKFHYWVSSIM